MSLLDDAYVQIEQSINNSYSYSDSYSDKSNNWDRDILSLLDEFGPDYYYKERFSLQKEISALKYIAKKYSEYREEIKRMIKWLKEEAYPEAQKNTIDWVFTQ